MGAASSPLSFDAQACHRGRPTGRLGAVILAGLLGLAGCDGRAPGDDIGGVPDATAVPAAPAPTASDLVEPDPSNSATGGADSVSSGTAPQSPWLPLRADALHDPRSPALEYLQEPAEALSELPPAQEGNFVDWVAALRQGYIEPRTNIYPETKVNLLDQDILFEDTAGMPTVRFPHLQHTEWLDCSNCHDALFVAKKGANDFGMIDILNGNFCGQCHGAVSFPLTQCARCHSVPRDAEQRVGDR